MLAIAILPGSSSFCFSCFLFFCVSDRDKKFANSDLLGVVGYKFSRQVIVMDGGNGAFVPDSSFGNLSDASMDLDFMDELLYDGCWLETADEFDFLQAGTSTSDYLNDPKQYFSLFEPNSGNRNVNPCQENYQVGTEKNLNETCLEEIPK